MSDADFQVHLCNCADFLEGLKTSTQKRKIALHSDLQDETHRVEAAFSAAYDALGSRDSPRYHAALAAIRDAVISWRDVDARCDELTSPSLPAPRSRP